MKKVVVLIGSLMLVGCYDSKSQDDTIAPPVAAPAIAPAITQLQQVGCTATQQGGGALISCADGSSASISAPPAMVAQDGNGAIYSNLIYMNYDSGGFVTVFNRTTGDVLKYDADGSLFSTSAVHFEQLNCTGNGYILGANLAGTLVINANGYPSNAQALKVAGTVNTMTSLSYFSAGQCINSTLNGGHLGAWSRVQPVVTLDSSSPASLIVPIQFVVQ